jgi:hypothetical protein
MVRTRIIGDVAITTGRNDVERARGSIWTEAFWFTQVWVRRGRDWQREAFHATYIHD